MKTKIIAGLLLTVFLSLVMVSAATFSLSPSTVELSKTTNSDTFIISTTSTSDVTVNIPSLGTLSDGDGNSLTLNADEASVTVSSTSPATIAVSYTLPTGTDLEDLALGTVSKTVTLVDADDENETAELSVRFVSDYCSVGNTIGGDLNIDRIDFTNKGAWGDDNEWYLLEEIEVEVRVKNTGNEDVDNVVVEWGLYNKDTKDFIIEEEEDNIDINEGERETWIFTLALDPDDFDQDDNEDDFVFYVKAYSDDRDLGQDLECNSEVEEDIKILRDKHFVVVNTDSVILTDLVPCNEFLEGNFELWNIGNDDEQDVFVVITNPQLGIAEKIEVGDVDMLENKKVTFDVRIPEDAEERTYELEIAVYDEDGDIFENDNDDLAKVITNSFRVEGSCIGEEPEPSEVTITAELDPETPEAVAGKQVIIKATLKNNGDSAAAYTISVFGNSAWSNLVSINPTILTLNPDESRVADIVLTIDEDAEGEKELTIKATSGDASTEQKVSVDVVVASEDQEFDEVGDHLKDNWFIYVIIIINVILIIAIIAVIRRMLSPRPAGL